MKKTLAAVVAAMAFGASGCVIIVDDDDDDYELTGARSTIEASETAAGE